MAMGFEVGVFYPNLSFPNWWSRETPIKPQLQFQLEEGLPTFRLTGAFLPKINYQSAVWWRKTVASFYPIIEKEWGRPDLIHARSALGAMVALEIKRNWGVKYVVSEHHTDVEEGLKGWKAKMAKEYYGEADALAAVSSGVAHQMEKLVGRSVETIPNYVDTEAFNPSETGKNPIFTFLNIGEGSYLKGHDIALDALDLLLKTGVKAQLRIGGRTDSLSKKLVQSAQQRGIAEHFTFLGLLSQAQVKEEMNRADCYLHTSRLEPFGKVLNEAMAMGLPIVSSDCAGPKDIVSEEVGLLVPAIDSQALALAMARMITEVGRYDKLAIRQLAIEKYGKAALLKRWADFYQQAFEGGI